MLARSDDSSISNQVPFTIHLPDATCFAQTRLFLLRTVYANVVPDCACTYSVRMVPSQGDFGYARQYLFLEKASIEFMFLIGTRPAPEKREGMDRKGETRPSKIDREEPICPIPAALPLVINVWSAPSSTTPHTPIQKAPQDRSKSPLSSLLWSVTPSSIRFQIIFMVANSRHTKNDIVPLSASDTCQITHHLLHRKPTCWPQGHRGGGVTRERLRCFLLHNINKPPYPPSWYPNDAPKEPLQDAREPYPVRCDTLNLPTARSWPSGPELRYEMPPP